MFVITVDNHSGVHDEKVKEKKNRVKVLSQLLTWKPFHSIVFSCSISIHGDKSLPSPPPLGRAVWMLIM